jgi:hypothetical protein
LAGLTESSNRRLGPPLFEFNGDFILAGKMARAVGNILLEISVYSLNGKPESKGALKRTNEHCQDDSGSFDVQFAHRRRIYASLVGCE